MRMTKLHILNISIGAMAPCNIGDPPIYEDSAVIFSLAVNKGLDSFNNSARETGMETKNAKDSNSRYELKCLNILTVRYKYKASIDWEMKKRAITATAPIINACTLSALFRFSSVKDNLLVSVSNTPIARAARRMINDSVAGLHNVGLSAIFPDSVLGLKIKDGPGILWRSSILFIHFYTEFVWQIILNINGNDIL